MTNAPTAVLSEVLHRRVAGRAVDQERATFAGDASDNIAAGAFARLTGRVRP